MKLGAFLIAAQGLLLAFSACRPAFDESDLTSGSSVNSGFPGAVIEYFVVCSAKEKNSTILYQVSVGTDLTDENPTIHALVTGLYFAEVQRVDISTGKPDTTRTKYTGPGFELITSTFNIPNSVMRGHLKLKTAKATLDADLVDCRPNPK